MEKTVDSIIEEARRLPVPQQLALIERLARSLQVDLENARALHEEFTAWDSLSDDALVNFEKGLFSSSPSPRTFAQLGFREHSR